MRKSLPVILIETITTALLQLEELESQPGQVEEGPLTLAKESLLSARQTLTEGLTPSAIETMTDHYRNPAPSIPSLESLIRGQFSMTPEEIRWTCHHIARVIKDDYLLAMEDEALSRQAIHSIQQSQQRAIRAAFPGIDIDAMQSETPIKNTFTNVDALVFVLQMTDHYFRHA